MSLQRNWFTTLVPLSLLGALLLSFVFTTHALASGEKAKKEVGEAAAAIGEYSVEQKDAAVAKAKELMKKLDDNIDALEGSLEENWDELKQSSRENYRKSIRELQKQRNELSEWYGSMKHSSKGAWSEVKKGFSSAYDGVVKAYSDTEEKMAEE